VTAEGSDADRAAEPSDAAEQDLAARSLDEDDAEDGDDEDEAADSVDDRAYAARLGDVLRRRSVPELRAFLVAQASRYGDARQVDAIRAQSDAEIEMLLHRMTLARADLRRLHPESARWLAARGLPGGPPGPSRGQRSGRRRPGGQPPSGPPGQPPRRGGRPPGGPPRRPPAR